MERKKKTHRMIKVFITMFSSQFLRDFGRWPANKGWPLKRGPLNKGSTVSLRQRLLPVVRQGIFVFLILHFGYFIRF